MGRFGYKKEQMLVVDDLMLGAEMAHNVGVQIAFARWSKESLPKLAKQMESCCNYTFSTVAELDEFLFSQA